MSNLRLINETEITSGVSEMYITDVFTDDFDIYKVVINDVSSASANAQNLFYRFVNASGSVVTSANYDYATLQLRDEQAFVQYRSVNDTEIQRNLSDLSPEGFSSVTYIFNPTNTNSYTFMLEQGMGAVTGLVRASKQIGVLKQTASMTGFGFFINGASSTFTSGVFRTYGLRVDS